MEISGLDPKLTICNIAVLPIKLYPPLILILKYNKNKCLTHKGFEPLF